MEKQIKLTIEQAKELYKSNPEYRTTLLSVFTDIELGILPNYPKSFEDLCEIKGYFITIDSKIAKIANILPANSENINIFATKKQAKSLLAFAQLSQLVKNMNGDWEPDWNCIFENKYWIYRVQDGLYRNCTSTVYNQLVFKTRELRDFSFEHHKQLWKDYYELD